MWKIINTGTLKECYIFENLALIKIYYFENNKKYIFSVRDSKNEYHVFKNEESDILITKFKSLLKAREFSWNVNIMSYKDIPRRIKRF